MCGACQSYRILVVFNILINWGINYAFEWGTLTRWGTLADGDGHKTAVPRVYVWKFVKVENVTADCGPNVFDSCAAISMDLVLTSFIIAWASFLLGSAGSAKEVTKGACPATDEAVLRRGVLKFFPLRSKSVCTRAILAAFEFGLLFGLTTVVVLGLLLHGSGMSGRGYIWFKSLFAGFQAFFVFTALHASATSTGKLVVKGTQPLAKGPEISHDDLETAPLVPGTGHDGRAPQFDTSVRFTPPIVGNVPDGYGDDAAEAGGSGGGGGAAAHRSSSGSGSGSSLQGAPSAAHAAKGAIKPRHRLASGGT